MTIFITCTAYLFKKLFSSGIEFLTNVSAENRRSITVLEKVTKEYMNNITSVKEIVNTDPSKNVKIVKTTMDSETCTKVKKGI